MYNINYSVPITSHHYWLHSDESSYQYNHIHPTLHEQIQAVLVVIVGADSSATQQLLSGVFGCQREISVLLQVRTSNNGHQKALLIHNGEFSCRRGEETFRTFALRNNMKLNDKNPSHLSYSSGEFHWLPLVSLQQVQQLDPPALSSPIKMAVTQNWLVNI